jgi:hypothetical protein
MIEMVRGDGTQYGPEVGIQPLRKQPSGHSSWIIRWMRVVLIVIRIHTII